MVRRPPDPLGAAMAAAAAADDDEQPEVPPKYPFDASTMDCIYFAPHRSGNCPPTTWWGASITVLKHPHCGHSHASVVKYP